MGNDESSIIFTVRQILLGRFKTEYKICGAPSEYGTGEICAKRCRQKAKRKETTCGTQMQMQN